MLACLPLSTARLVKEIRWMGLVTMLALLWPSTMQAQLTKEIKLNQVGFYPPSVKIAVITASTPASVFYVVSADHRDTVFRGELGAPRRSAFSSLVTRLAIFTDLKKSGRYVVAVPALGVSYPFRIGPGVLEDLAKASIKAFYYQRSGMALEQRYAGKWTRREGHPDTAVLIHSSAAGKYRPAGKLISSHGGWYDAGDYNKYIVNSGITMGTLLSAYEDFPAYYDRLRIDIPVAGAGVPDMLEETLYNLRWMLTMQDPSDGGVYHKCTNAVFDPMVMPDMATKPRYVVQKSTPAALDFCAVMAQAARILRPMKKQFPGLADSCLRAAQTAWEWALKNNAVEYNQRELNRTCQPAVTTGEYGDRHFNDEWLWAAAELLATTKKSIYLDKVKERMADPVVLPSWGNVAMLGYYTLVRRRADLPQAKEVIRSMQDTITRMADRYIASIPANAFGVVMGQSLRDFVWGSNAVAANEAIVLINAWLCTRNNKYLEGAQGNMDYILGRNATGYCFVTGQGSLYPMHPHHRPSIADGIDEPVPGLLAGGPNPGRQDRCPYPFQEPETSYVDSDCAYASNEIAINWNAPLVYLAGALDAQDQSKGLR